MECCCIAPLHNFSFREKHSGFQRLRPVRFLHRREKILLTTTGLTVAAANQKSSVDKTSNYVRSVRVIPVKIMTVGKARSAGAQLLVADFSSKIQRYCPFQETQLRPNPKNSSEVAIQVQAESEKMLRSLTARDWVVRVDERGREVTSEQISTIIAHAGDTGASALVFCIGGPYGHGSAITERCNESICLSHLVLNHEVALLVLIEQVYRAWAILKGEKYHHS